MAPDLALSGLKALPRNSVVLDPMVGSGTVVRHAIELGHRAVGFDLDPLAVLMTTVWTRPVNATAVAELAASVVHDAKLLALTGLKLPWIDKDAETLAFTKFWFARKQRNDLRRLAFILNDRRENSASEEELALLDVLRLALSRIIITKDRGASLARDVSHSRPHRVALESDYDVFSGFEKAVAQILKGISQSPVKKSALIQCGDARKMTSLKKASVDAVFTSPPYLNQIDYMRGHRMSLIWLGHSLPSLRVIRGHSIGSERGADSQDRTSRIASVAQAMVDCANVTPRFGSMVSRYAGDICELLDEIKRVLKPGGKSVFVVGNSNLKGAFINNAEGVACAAISTGFKLRSKVERELPVASRYLPLPSTDQSPLGKRMRTESVMTFTV